MISKPVPSRRNGHRLPATPPESLADDAAPTVSPHDELPTVPCAIESEMCTLGSLMLAGGEPSLVAGIRATVAAEDFYQADHQILFRAACDVYDRCRALDAMLLREELVRRRVLDEVGGLEYLGQILHAVPSAFNGVHYAADVREKSVLRRMIAAAHELVARARSPMVGEKADEIARDFLARLHGVSLGRAGESIVKMERVIAGVLDAGMDGTASSRVRTGLRELDGLLGGLPRNRLTLLAGRPGMGKSQVGKQIVRNVAGGLAEDRAPDGRVLRPAQPPVTCGIVSVEETLEKIGQNFLAAAAGVENNRIAYGTCESAEWAAVINAAPGVAGLPIFLTDRPVRLSDVEAAVTAMVTRHKCEVIFVDYLQLIHGPEAATKEQEIARVSIALKNLGKTLGVTMLVAAQLSRANETGGVRRPELRDLRHSGQIEQDGDAIVLLHREDYYRYKDDGFKPTHLLEAIVAKNKDGPLGTALLHFSGKYQTVRDRTLAETYAPATRPTNGAGGSLYDNIDPGDESPV